MMNIKFTASFASILILSLVAFASADDYEGGETETAITGLSGLSGLGGLSALANGIVTGYAPMNGAGSEMGQDVVLQGNEPRGMGTSESSDNESGDYEEDSNDSAASEEQPILSRVISFISGGRHRRSVDQSDELSEEPRMAASKIHSRVKRGYKGWVPYVSTYVKTDKKAHFKWGVSIIYLVI